MEVVAGALGTLIPKLFQLLRKEYNLQKGVKKDVEFLSRELTSIHAALRQVASVPPNQVDEQVKIWAGEVRDLSYTMEDAVDEFLASTECSQTATNSHKLMQLLEKLCNLLTVGKPHHQIANKIKGIKILVKEVADRRDLYKVNDVVSNLAANTTIPNLVATTMVDPRLVAMFRDQKELVGIDVVRHEITEKLTYGDGNVLDKNLKILSIFGFGGLGKTTLAKVVHDGLREKFSLMAFISVGQKPDVKKFLRDILFELDKEGYIKSNAPSFDEKQLIEKLQELLQNKRYFIVIDDIWNVEAWKIIRCALKDSDCGSRVITTTRVLEVAKSSGEVYRLKPLSPDNSENLFYTRLYGGKSKYPFGLATEVSKKIIQKCGGVPLAILTIASLFEGKQRQDWSKVYDSIGFGHGENQDVENTRKILLFSYYDLPYYLRTCLLHLTSYPEDYTIMKETLVWKWVAEGFIQEESKITQFELGERYFNELVDRSMIQPVEIKNLGRVVGCRVHDLVLDMICPLSEEENFVSVLDMNDQSIYRQSKSRRLAVQKRIIKEGDSHEKLCTSQVRSFNATMCEIHQMPSLSTFRTLRVLAMEGCTFMEGGSYQLDHLGSLLQLRYLGLRNMPIVKLPEEIGNLKFLQVLDLKGTTLKELPQSIGLLRQLQCLNVESVEGVSGLHLLGNLRSLEELTLDSADGSHEFVVQLGKLIELRKLYMSVFICRSSHVSVVKALVKSLSNMQKIQVLHLSIACVIYNCYDWEGYAPSRQFHEIRLTTHNNTLPAWINPSLVPYLTNLWLRVAHVKAHEMETFGSFPELTTLILETCEDFLPNIMDDIGFPRLRYFNTNAVARFMQGAICRDLNTLCSITSMWSD